MDQCHYRTSVGNTDIEDLVFADDAVIFAELLEVLVMALEALHEKATSFATPSFMFGVNWMEQYLQSVNACGEGIEILEEFTYLGYKVNNDGGSSQEVVRWIGLAHGVMDSLNYLA